MRVVSRNLKSFKPAFIRAITTTLHTQYCKKKKKIGHSSVRNQVPTRSGFLSLLHRRTALCSADASRSTYTDGPKVHYRKKIIKCLETYTENRELILEGGMLSIVCGT